MSQNPHGPMMAAAAAYEIGVAVGASLLLGFVGGLICWWLFS